MRFAEERTLWETANTSKLEEWRLKNPIIADNVFENHDENES